MRSMKLFLLLVFMLLEAYGFSDETDKQALLEFKSQVSQDKNLSCPHGITHLLSAVGLGLHVDANTRELLVWILEG